MIVFGVLIPAIYSMEIILLDVYSKYLALNLAVSIAMVYLTTNVSTHTLLETRAKVEATEADLRVGTEIQTGSLPTNFPDRPEFEIYASMDPAKEVGGDFYDFFMIDEDHLAMVIADVSGKGVPAALFMMSSKIYINDHATMGGYPSEILERVNKLVYANNDAHMFVTVLLDILEISTGRLQTRLDHFIHGRNCVGGDTVCLLSDSSSQKQLCIIKTAHRKEKGRILIRN